MTVSAPTVTSASMTQVSGRKMVTPCGHQAARGGGAHGLVEVHHLGDGVGAEDLVDAFGLEGDDAPAVGDQHGGDVGEVELAVGVVGGEQVELGEERFGFEAVDAGVDLGRVELGGREGLLLDDGRDLGRVGLAAQDAAVAGGVGRDGGKDGHGGVLAQMQLAERGERLRADERDVAGEDQQVLRDGRLPGSCSQALSTCMAWPVPSWASCRTKLTPVGATAARTCSASWPMMQ